MENEKEKIQRIIKEIEGNPQEPAKNCKLNALWAYLKSLK